VLSQVTVRKSLNKIASTYLLISALISLIFLIVIILQNEVTGIFWITLPLCIVVVVLTALINYNVLRQPLKIRKSSLLLNIIITAAQIPYVAFDGFQFKYNQGLQVVGYLKFSIEREGFKTGIFFNNFNYHLNIRFLELPYLAVGVDFLALFLFLFYIFQYQFEKVEPSPKS
jgi:hypothetical protein